MRDRLIELIRSIPKIDFPIGSRAQGKTYQTAANIADHLLANGVVILDPEKYPPVTNRGIIDTVMGEPLDEIEELIRAKNEGRVIVPPCKVGDKVYIIDEDDTAECNEPCVVEAVVIMLYIGKHGIAVDLSLPDGFRINIMAMVGKNVFLTREDAEKALAERSGE